MLVIRGQVRQQTESAAVRRAGLTALGAGGWGLVFVLAPPPPLPPPGGVGMLRRWYGGDGDGGGGLWRGRHSLAPSRPRLLRA